MISRATPSRLAILFVGLFPTAASALVGPTTVAGHPREGVVMILSSQAGRAGFCTAVALAPTVLATAAHCTPSGAALRVHYRDEAGAPVLQDVAEVARDPLFRPDAAARRVRSVDLALVRLSRALPARFAPVALGADMGASIGQRYRILGYGVSREGDARSAGVLRAGVVALRAPLSNVLLWAEDPTGRGLGACQGDSGAPVLAMEAPRLVAVVDWATGAGAHACGALTQAAWIAPRRAWIASVLARWRASP